MKKKHWRLTIQATENFNIFYNIIGKTLADTISSIGRNPNMKRILKSRFLMPINGKNIYYKIGSLENRYSTNYDGLNNFLLKKIKYAIVRTLAFLVNKCFEERVLPKCSKKAFVLPIYMRGSLDEVEGLQTY